MPKTECLKDVVERIVPYLTKEIAVDMNAGKTVLVTAHGNSIRAIVKHIDCISDEDIAGVNIPTGIPLLYEFDDDFEPIKKGGEYLDPAAAKEAIAAVANQGKK
jgi:2,3-bisphosphoglycerate-dependent phosphoglycerate mutase